MGVIKELVLLPVAPLRGTLWVADKVAEQADRQHSSESAGVQQLDEVDEARRRGDVDEEKADELEEQVLERQLTRAAKTREAPNDG
jgi:Gas vesicle protein G